MPTIHRRALLLSALSAAASLAPLFTHAQATFPSKPLRLIVPAPPGGATDLLARKLSVGLGTALGQSIVVDNRPGGSGIIAAQSVLSSPRDGHTLYLGFTSTLQLPLLMSSLPVDFARDLAPVSILGQGADVFIASSKLGVNTVAEFVALAKSKPGQLSIASYGNGTTSHLNIEWLKMSTGIDVLHVPYKGAAPAMADLAGGQIDAAFVDGSTAKGQLKNEKLRYLANAGTNPYPALPKLRTLGEQGYPGFEANGFAAIFVAAGTPAPIIKQLSQAIAAQIHSPELLSYFAENGSRPMGSTPEEMAAMLERDRPRWAAIIQRAKVKLD
ncbi:tripartite tricarboxylate transporter substrate binding protein [Hydrogenophaga sp. 2FB]|uniref:Bug family tripartite tricarboxylate transporter substrate binding protein n=1 Tax=Hydrogenophaga sp. 2FB TaxID=2502187 RepID=UPI0010F6D747|nr:tripartite tricarboxylate transporter substrate binding protein [Hydrogenophaga sp. 2FB]